MNKGIFYKVLAAFSTAGIVALAVTQGSAALKKSNQNQDQLAKTIAEIKDARKDALAELKILRAEVNSLRSRSFKELSADSSKALRKIETAQTTALSEMKVFRRGFLKEINELKTNTLGDLRNYKITALGEIKVAKSDSLSELQKSSQNNQANAWLLLYLYRGSQWAGEIGNERLVEKVPMPSMKECIEAGITFQEMKEPLSFGGNKFRAFCIEGGNVEF